MRIVIIGSTGLIGSELMQLALGRGHSVVALSRKQVQAPRSERVQYALWDGRTAADLVPLIEGSDTLVNLAGESIGKGPWTPSRKALQLSSRLEPARAVSAAWKMTREKPLLLVQASAIGIYGTGEDAREETSTPGDDYLSNLAKQWEAASVEVESLGARRVVIRTGVVLEKTHGVLPQVMLPFKFLVGGPIGSGKQVLSWIHIEDELRAILSLIESPDSNGIYNLTAPQPVTNAEMGKAISKITHLPYWMPMPAFALKLVLGEMSTLVLEGQNVLPMRLQQAGFDFKFPSIDSALKNLLSK